MSTSANRFQVNDLVIDAKSKYSGIGCVSKVFTSKVQVNFGLYDSVKINPNRLVSIDTSSCKTVSFEIFNRRRMNLDIDKNFNYCIVGNELKNFVGIGWVTVRVATSEDLKNYPRIVR